jgi:hypothetical protein
MNLWGNGFFYTKSGFLLNGSNAKLHQESVDLLIKFIVHNDDKIISLHK